MTLFLALSCLQGRPAQTAADELCALHPTVGIQLTPGNIPTRLDIQRPTRTHHGYDPSVLRSRVWSPDGGLMWSGDSVHPPRQKDLGHLRWKLPEEAGPALETMYPGYAGLDSGASLERAMDMGLQLAVDVAHLAIQRHVGALSAVTLSRLLGYHGICEVHVSRSHDDRDVHLPILDDGDGVAYAREMLQDGKPVVLECYMHRLSVDERHRQVERLLGP